MKMEKKFWRFKKNHGYKSHFDFSDRSGKWKRFCDECEWKEQLHEPYISMPMLNH